MKILKFVLLIFLIIFGYLAYALGLFGSPRPRDLGITFTGDDINSFQDKSGIGFATKPAVDNPSDALVFTGTHPVRTSFTSAELTSSTEYHSWQYLPFENTQIKLGQDNIEISGNLDTKKIIPYFQAIGKIGPMQAEKIARYIPSGHPQFYLNFGGQVDNGSLTLSINSVSIAGLPIPSKFLIDNIEAISSFIDDSLASMSGFAVNHARIQNGNLVFDGTLPNTEIVAKE